MPLTLDIEKHIYTDEKGVVVPSVTQIIQTAFPFVSHNKRLEKYYQERGNAVHKAIHYLEKGSLDPSTVGKDIWPYIRGYYKFIEELKGKTLASEEILHNLKYGYCGTLDRRTRGIIWDYKTGAPKYADVIQLHAYAHAIDKPDCDKIGVYLNAKGGYKLKDCTNDRRAWPTFLACKTIFDTKQYYSLN